MAVIAVVGAGLLGRLLTLMLSEKHDVSVFEKKKLDSDSTTGRLAAAMVAPLAESVNASAEVVSMGFASMPLWRGLLSHFEHPHLYKQAGSVVVTHPQDQGDLSLFLSRVTPRHDNDLATLEHQQLAALEPELAEQFMSGVFLSSEGHIDNAGLYNFTTSFLRASDVQIHEEVECDIDDGTVLVDGESHQFDLVLDTRGLGARADMLDESESLRGVRGEIIRVVAPEVTLSRPVRMMHPRYPLYVVPKPGNEYVIGATEIESESEHKVTVRSTMELLSAAYSVHRGFAEAEVISAQTGLRPAFRHQEPKVTMRGKHVQLNGLYRHGFLLAPYVAAKTLAELDLLPEFMQSGLPAEELLKGTMVIKC